MTNKIYLLVLFFSFSAFAQHRTLQITNLKNGQITVFEENQRVKIRTLDHKKWVGNLTFTDSLSFTVNNHKIAIDSLQSIKNQPKSVATFKTVVLISGAALIGASIIAASGGSDAAFLLFAIGGGTTLSSGLIGSRNSSYTHLKWSYKIVDSSLKGEQVKQK
ncbi:hypothetical protein [Flavobacterium sp.]|uniref:hypothetical protein n=1 Tax=Flavobacterium sp. TaxID=239 RepID=UPI00286E8C90|nr:hypothetical protein [Flavobacterium sp.]